LLDQINIVLRDWDSESFVTVHIDVHDNTLSRKWLTSLNNVIDSNLILEKNYCFMGFANNDRNGNFIINEINNSVQAINNSQLDYTIDDVYSWGNCIIPGKRAPDSAAGGPNHDAMNQLHYHFEKLQGSSTNISSYYTQADPETRWHIRQLNLLCHEFECWALSYRKQVQAPEWQRPSQLMCWLQAPRFKLDATDYELFGIETLNRPLGGVYVGVNKAVGKHHWEVFCDEGPDAVIDNLTTSNLASQTEAAADFDIEWARDPGSYKFQQDEIAEFKNWLVRNNFDPNDKSLTIGHPQVASVDLKRSFGTEDYQQIWAVLQNHLDVYSISTSNKSTVYQYKWNDRDYKQRQIEVLK
jgi:hypothetical protein